MIRVGSASTKETSHSEVKRKRDDNEQQQQPNMTDEGGVLDEENNYFNDFEGNEEELVEEEGKIVAEKERQEEEEGKRENTIIAVNLNPKTGKRNKSDFVRSYRLSYKDHHAKTLFPIPEDSNVVDLKRTKIVIDSSNLIYQSRTNFLKEVECMKDVFSSCNRIELMNHSISFLEQEHQKQQQPPSNYLLSISNPYSTNGLQQQESYLPYLSEKLDKKNVAEYVIQLSILVNFEEFDIPHTIINEMIEIMGSNLGQDNNTGWLRLADLLFLYVIQNKKVMIPLLNQLIERKTAYANSVSIFKRWLTVQKQQPESARITVGESVEFQNVILSEAIDKIISLFNRKAEEDEIKRRILTSTSVLLSNVLTEILAPNTLKKSTSESFLNVKDPIQSRVVAERLSMWFLEGFPVEIPTDMLFDTPQQAIEDLKFKKGLSSVPKGVVVARVALNFVCQIQDHYLFPSIWLAYIARIRMDCMISNINLPTPVQLYWLGQIAVDVNALYRQAYRKIITDDNSNSSSSNDKHVRTMAIAKYGTNPLLNFSEDLSTIRYTSIKEDTIGGISSYKAPITLLDWLIGCAWSKKTIRPNIGLSSNDLDSFRKRYINILLAYHTPSMRNLVSLYESFMWKMYFTPRISTVFNDYIPKETPSQNKIGSTKDYMKDSNLFPTRTERTNFQIELGLPLDSIQSSNLIVSVFITMAKTPRERFDAQWKLFLDLFDKVHLEDRTKLVELLKPSEQSKRVQIYNLFERVSFRNAREIILEILQVVKPKVGKSMKNAFYISNILKVFLLEELDPEIRKSSSDKIDALVSSIINEKTDISNNDDELIRILNAGPLTIDSRCKQIIEGGYSYNKILELFDSLLKDKRTVLIKRFLESAFLPLKTDERKDSKPLQKLFKIILLKAFLGEKEQAEGQSILRRNSSNLPMDFIRRRFAGISFIIEKVNRFVFALRASPFINSHLAYIPCQWMELLLNANPDAVKIDRQTITDIDKEIVKDTPFSKGYPYLMKQANDRNKNAKSYQLVLRESLTFSSVINKQNKSAYCYNKQSLGRFERLLSNRLNQNLFSIVNLSLVKLNEKFNIDHITASQQTKSKTTDFKRIFGTLTQSEIADAEDESSASIQRELKQQAIEVYLKNLLYLERRVVRLTRLITNNSLEDINIQFKEYLLNIKAKYQEFLAIKNNNLAAILDAFKVFVQLCLTLSGLFKEDVRKLEESLAEAGVYQTTTDSTRITIMDPQTGQPLALNLQNTAEPDDVVVLESLENPAGTISVQKLSVLNDYKTALSTHIYVTNEIVKKFLGVKKPTFEIRLMALQPSQLSQPSGLPTGLSKDLGGLSIIEAIGEIFIGNKNVLTAKNFRNSSNLLLRELVNVIDTFQESLPDEYVIKLYPIIFGRIRDAQIASIKELSPTLSKRIDQYVSQTATTLTFSNVLRFSEQLTFIVNIYLKLRIVYSKLEVPIQEDDLLKMLFEKIGFLFGEFQKLVVNNGEEFEKFINNTTRKYSKHLVLTIWRGINDVISILTSSQLIQSLETIVDNEKYNLNLNSWQEAVNRLTSDEIVLPPPAQSLQTEVLNRDDVPGTVQNLFSDKENIAVELLGSSYSKIKEEEQRRLDFFTSTDTTMDALIQLNENNNNNIRNNNTKIPYYPPGTEKVGVIDLTTPPSSPSTSLPPKKTSTVITINDDNLNLSPITPKNFTSTTDSSTIEQTPSNPDFNAIRFDIDDEDEATTLR